MKVEYKRDLRHNYLVITLEDYQDIEPYSLKILEHQPIRGTLPVSMRRMDYMLLFYYEITAKQSLITILDRTALKIDQLRKLCIGIFQVMEAAYELLLIEDNFILTPEYIYIDIATSTPYLCYLPGYGVNLEQQMNSFMEYLMNKIDYNDKEAVVLVYRLYAVCRESGFVYDQLMEVLELQDTNIMNQNNNINKLTSTRTEKESLGSDDNFHDNTFHDNTLPKHNIGASSYSDEDSLEKFKTCGNTDSKKSINKIINQFSCIKYRWAQRIGSTCTQNKRASAEVSQKITHNKNNRNQNRRQSDSSNMIRNNNCVSYDVGDKNNQNNSDREQIKEKSMEDTNIPIMMERVEGETELLYYPFKTYLYCIGCIITGIAVVITALVSRVLFNSYSNQLDYSKLFALLLLVLCVEGYLISKIFDRNNKITRMAKTYDYIDPRLVEAQPFINYKGYMGSIHDKINKENKKEQLHIENGTLESSPDEEDINPTCLLNSAAEQKKSFILKAKSDSSYNNITIAYFPFFIGKLKKNVDYCLENNTISRFHAKITKEGENYYLTDLNSTNGTFINKEALQTYEKRELKLGDEVTFANITYQFMEQ